MLRDCIQSTTRELLNWGRNRGTLGPKTEMATMVPENEGTPLVFPNAGDGDF